MKTHPTHILLLILLLLLSPLAIAEDDSCELKTENNKNMTDNSLNEFTRDKTWRFKADSILQDEKDKMKTKNKGKIDADTKTSSLNI